MQSTKPLTPPGRLTSQPRQGHRCGGFEWSGPGRAGLDWTGLPLRDGRRPYLPRYPSTQVSTSPLVRQGRGPVGPCCSSAAHSMHPEFHLPFPFTLMLLPMSPQHDSFSEPMQRIPAPFPWLASHHSVTSRRVVANGRHSG